MHIFQKYIAATILLFGSLFTYAQPNSNFTTSKVEGCSPFLVQFTSAEQSSSYTHTWDFGNGVVNNAPINPSRTYTATGTYTVKHTITGPGGSHTTTKTAYITVFPSPTINFSGNPLSGCPPLITNFTDNSTPGVSGGLTYNWVFTGGSPGTSANKNESVTYTNSGKYNVTLQVTNSKGCFSSETKTQYIEVLDKPVIDFSAANNKTDYCSAPASVTFNPSVTGAPTPYTYSWNFSPGTSGATNPTQIFTGPAPAQYNVTLTVTAGNTCTNTITKNNYIKLHKPQASFTAPSTACMFEVVNFNNTGSTGATYLWDFGNNSPKSTLANPSYAYNTSGTFTVTLVTNIGGCTDTFKKDITIHPQANPAIITSPIQPCPAPQTISFSTNPAVSTYGWSIQDVSGTSTSSSATPSHTYNTNGYFPVTLTLTDSKGCKDTVRHTVIIYPLNVYAAVNARKADSGCQPLSVYFTVTVKRDSGFVYPYGVKSFKWHFGDGNTSSAQNPQYTYTDTGRFKAYVEVETNNGCIRTDTVLVVVGSKPIIDSIEATPRVTCPNDPVNFTAHVRGYKPLYYNWSFGDGGTARVINDSTTTHIYGCADTFDIILSAMHNGCQSDTLHAKDYIEVHPPCAGFKGKINCANKLKIDFTNESIGDSSRVWHFGDGNTSPANNPTHTYAAPGTYIVKLITHNSKYNCYDTLIKPFYVGGGAPQITADKTKLCKEQSVTFTGSANTPPAATNYFWYIDGVIASYLEQFTFQFLSPGLHSVKLVTQYEGCTDTIEKKDWITVGQPIPGFKSDKREICELGEILYTDTSKAAQGTTIHYKKWTLGFVSDTLTTTANTTVKKYYIPGKYTIKLVVTDDIGCKDSVTRVDYIEVRKPLAGYQIVTPACVGQPITVSNLSVGADTCYWDFGDGKTSQQFSPAHSYSSKGTFNTQLIVADNMGCRDTFTQTISTNKPTANFTMSDSMSICPPLIVTFDGSVSTGQYSYRWDFDDGSSPTNKVKQTVVYNNQKEYNVRLIVTDTAGCTDTLVKTVQVLGYAGAFSYDTTNGCAPLTVNFTSYVKGNVPTMIWDFGDGNTQLGNHTQPNITYTYKTPGKYIPRMIFNNNQGCIVGSDGNDTIYVDGVTPEFENTAPCQYTTVQFFDKSRGEFSPINYREWTFHNGAISQLADPKMSYGPPGNYKVKLVATNTRGCIDSIEREITIYKPLEMYAGADTTICLTDSVQLFPTGGVSYMWSPAATLSCANCNNPHAFPKTKTRYVAISTDVNGCHDTDDVEIDIKTHVTSIVGDGGEICDGEAFYLSVSGARTYAWTPSASLDNASSPTPVAKPNETTKYRVIAYEGRCIPDTSIVDVIVHPRPVVNARGEQTIVAGTSADLFASGENISRFLWSPSATLSCAECSDPIAKPYKTTTYTVKVFSKYECVDSTDVTVTVLCDKSQLFVPNTFTPNGDGMNDVFMVRGTGITSLEAFRVYNRWGEIVFERTNVNVNDKANGWDGTYNGAQLPPDVYIYTVDAYCENGDLLQIKGDVTIIR